MTPNDKAATLKRRLSRSTCDAEKKACEKEVSTMEEEQKKAQHMADERVAEVNGRLFLSG